jgi:hypothetical protein
VQECGFGLGQNGVAHRVVLSDVLLLKAREQVLLATLENDLVVDVGRIHDELDTKAEVVLHDASDDVGRDVVLCMAQMGIFVHCRATGIPRHHFPCRIDRDKIILVPRQAVVDLESGQLDFRRSLRGNPWGLLATVGSHAVNAKLFRRHQRQRACAWEG